MRRGPLKETVCWDAEKLSKLGTTCSMMILRGEMAHLCWPDSELGNHGFHCSANQSMNCYEDLEEFDYSNSARTH